ncbi:thioredoxin family protein [Salipiger sp. H15]|uniref:Thioredoxin family protein n=1 Tax=Alloyangia sp. H15 TaxID=3029062 RepID=A0AAU8ALD8_9RHOB
MTRPFPALAAAALIACAAALPVPAAQLGDDGLHKAPWMHDTFKDLREDLAEANAAGQRLLILVEQRGCIYCTKMHEEVFPQPEIEKMLSEDYFVIQINMFGDVDVTDLDGTVLPEKDMVQRWGLLFTPTMIFLPEEAGPVPAPQAAVAVMPGAFEKSTTRHLLSWVLEKGYDGDEPFQKYHARKLEEDRAKN